MKEDYVKETLATMMSKREINQDLMAHYIRLAWEHGAITALLEPGAAYRDIGRTALAAYVCSLLPDNIEAAIATRLRITDAMGVRAVKDWVFQYLLNSVERLPFIKNAYNQEYAASGKRSAN